MSKSPVDNILIHTKIHRPIIPIDLVPRPKLTDWLDSRRNRPLTLVSAPAGYGKSTLISSWLETCKYPFAWLTLDDGDNDLAVFLSYFLSAVRTIFPQAGTNTQALLMTPNPTPLKELASNLNNDINQLDQFFVLVLDDYEVIEKKEIHDLISELLIHPSRNLHLVLCTRTDPLIPLVNLRAQSQLTEIRAQDLRFTEEEAHIFLQKVLDPEVDKATARSLAVESEGWVTGLRLAALTLRHRVGKQPSPEKPTANNRYVSDYLMSEILDSQISTFPDWLIKTSILARFNAGLCEAVCIEVGEELKPDRENQLHGDDFLEWLIVSNLFAISLDDHNRWIRYHHLFRDFLQNELHRRYDSAQIKALHIRAYQWFAQNNFIEEALHHAYAAGDTLAAAQLVEQNAWALLNDDQWHILEKWIAQLPDNIIKERPKLLLVKAWVFFHKFALGAIPPILETIEKILGDDETTKPLRGEVDFFWGHHWYWQGQSVRSLEFLDRALARIPGKFHLARGEAELFWGLASQISGQKNEAIQKLSKWFYYDPSPHPGRQTVRCRNLSDKWGDFLREDFLAPKQPKMNYTRAMAPAS